jgi:hypothetical protein
MLRLTSRDIATAYCIIFALKMKRVGRWTATFPFKRRSQAAPRQANDAKDGMLLGPRNERLTCKSATKCFSGGRGIASSLFERRGTAGSMHSVKHCRDDGYIYRPRKPR